MGRNRLFDEADVVQRATHAFLVAGYEGTSVGELVTATGLHRGSLYQAFGSKRGLFLACLRHVATDRSGDVAMDLVLVALLELAPRDPEVRGLLADHLDRRGVTAHDLGARLLARALIHPSED
ncbi:TetR/AcrR family transcriptional regulator [Nocardioides sp. Leaf374]|uniref:TetR/AcrR family transcriptional regulator n=1 Tax=Nocardioides sp. Leaf374 TaxID=2876560 RepID=UPI001E63D896|nr:helix-turn-helix domain-containing protein [Nocardioides sp. Leaf374]